MNGDFDTDSEDELPPMWEERAMAGGQMYYVNHASQTTQWVHPRTGLKKKASPELPYGWKMIVQPDGGIEFFEERKKLRTHTDPRIAFAKSEGCPKTYRQLFKYDSMTKALQIVYGLNLSEKVALVTGANSGIGFETARSLALQGCCVVMACRDMLKAHEAIRRIKAEHGGANCVPMFLRLDSLISVRNFAERFTRRFKSLQMLFLNAATFGLPYSLTDDNLETTFQVNYLSHFYLTLLLQHVLVRNSARIIIVTCESHRFSELNESNFTREALSPSDKKNFWSLMAYNNSKLCCVMLAHELKSRWESKGIQTFAVHPGNVVRSNLCRHSLFYRILFAICRPFTKSLQQAAATSIFCATSPDLYLTTGRMGFSCDSIYYNSCQPCEPSPISANHVLGAKLWSLSMDMISNATNNGAN